MIGGYTDGVRTTPRPLARPALALAAGVGLLLSAAAPGQDRPADNATAARIADGVEKVREGKLLDAVEQFQRVLDTAGDDLVPVGKSQQVPARWVVHGHLARLPAEGVKLYRQRVDGQAARRLEEARKARDDAGLRRLLADMFAARSCEEAILELARRAFERGEFDAAEHFWRMLLPPPAEGDEQLLRFPDPKTEPAAVRARLLLVKLFRGERDEAKDELKAFRETHPDSAGLLAGKTGKYADTLAELLGDPTRTTLPRPPAEPGWPTFAGSPTRDGGTRTRLPYFWPDVPIWKTPLPLLRGGRFDGLPPDPLHPRALAFYPVVSGGRAYLADGARLFALDLMTGRVSKAGEPKGGEDTRIPTRHDIRHTLTEADGILYARFGPAALHTGENEGRSFIVAFGPRKGDTEERDALWKLEPPATADSPTHFEGAPVVYRDRLYVGLWRQAGGEAVAGVACYRLDDPKAAPELAWQRILGKAGSEPNGETRFRHALLAVSGPNVVYCTDGGTVAALDAATGRPAWEYRYPRAERPTLPRYRDLTPPLADGGRVYAAPADTDRLLCLDAYTGRLIWERESVEVVHLLGTARGRLIATVGGQVKGIRGFNLRTGADSGTGGWTIHDDGGETTFGRGLVSEEAVVWPTRHGLQFLNPADGSPLRSPIHGSFGNLTYADGVLLVTTTTEVWGYVSEAKQLGNRRRAAAAEPDNALRQAKLARSLIDAGLYPEAELAALKAGEARERLLWLLAEKVIRDGDRDGAKRLYGELAKGDGSFAAAGAVRLAEMCEDPEKARAAWRLVFGKRGTVRDEHGVPWPARTYAGMRAGMPLVMRSYAPGEWLAPGAIGATPEPPPEVQPTLVRNSGWSLDDPTLRVLHASEEGVVAVGKSLFLFPHRKVFPTQMNPDAASLDQGAVTTAGPGGLASVWTHDGQVHWEIDGRPDRPVLAPVNRPALSAASGTDGPASLTPARPGDHASFLYGGRVIAWLSPPFGEGRTYLAPRTHSAGLYPNYSLGRSAPLAQTSGGRMLVWDAGNRPPREYSCTRKPWPEPPTYLGQDRFLLPDDGAVFLFDARAGKELARYTLPGPDGLTGELPRFRVHQGDPLLVIDRNHGVELDRLRIDGLKRAWDRSPILVGRSLDDVAFAGDRFVTAADGVLAAHAWKDGNRLWDVPLPDAPETRWKVSVAPQGLLVHPAEALMTRPGFDALGEFRRARGWGGLLRAAGRSYDAWAARELPVLVIDPADGRLVQRLTFPAAGPAAGLAVTPKGVVVVTGKGSWTLAAK